MKIKEITAYLNKSIPLALQESYDNAGLITGDPEREASGVLVSLDITEAVLEEALERGLNMVVAHHPIIFKGLKKLTGDGLVERCIAFAIKNDIAIYAAHTNLDHLPRGVSFALAAQLGLQHLRVLRPMEGMLRKLVTFCPTDRAVAVREALFSAGAGHIGNYDSCSYNAEGYGTFRAGEGAQPYAGEINELHHEPEVRIETIFPAWLKADVIGALLKAHPYEEVAYDIYPVENLHQMTGPGAIGELSDPMPARQFLDHLKTVTGCDCIRYGGRADIQIKKVALCGGAGSFLIPDAIRSGADIFITADLKYHDFFEADQRILLADAGHFETEKFARQTLKDILMEKFPNFAVLISNVNTNPVNYL